MRKLFIIAALAVTLPGCASFQKVIPVLNDVQAAVSDASAILDAVRSVVTVFFLARPAPDAQIKVERVLGDVDLALSATVRALRGVDNASKEQLDAAWKDFRGAYSELVVVLRDLGIVSAEGKMATRRGAVTLPEPLAMGAR
jgi:hypothetical protein